MVKISDAEWVVMVALWQGSPATVRQVIDRLPKSHEWAYTTVKTMLDRLVAKEFLQTRKQGQISTYSPLLSKDQARQSALRGLVERAFDGTVGALIHHLIAAEKLSAQDRLQIEQWLHESDEQRVD